MCDGILPKNSNYGQECCSCVARCMSNILKRIPSLIVVRKIATVISR